MTRVVLGRSAGASSGAGTALSPWPGTAAARDTLRAALRAISLM